MRKKPSDEVLAHYPELGSVPAGAIRIEAAAGEMLFDARAPSPPYALLVEGRIRVSLPTRNGSELFLYYLEPRRLCAMTTLALLTGTPSRVRATTETPVRALGLPGAVFLRLLADAEPFRKIVFAALAFRADALLTLLEEAVTHDLSARLARRLLEGEPVIAATHQQLAEGLGSSRERVSRLLQRFQRHGYVRLRRGSIRIVDPAALRRAGSADE